MADARETVERLARESYGRLVAFLARRTRDVAAAEDALGDALVAALEAWPRQGVPEQPESWLLATARRRLIDGQRRAGVRRRHAEELAAVLAEGERRAAAPAGERAQAWPHDRGAGAFPDERLAWFFVCAHPAIDPAVRTPLMLQTVLGLDAARIARAFLVAPAAMGQRLVRAKTKIREAGIPFELPGERELPQRLDAVLEAIYAAYGLAWDATAGADAGVRDLADEAIWLAHVLRGRLPREPEILGLLALMLFCEARRPARRDRQGHFVPLLEQDPAVWSRPALRAAEHELRAAAAFGRPGRFQLEAAIQSAHVEGVLRGPTDWDVIAGLYEQLVARAPTLGSRIAQAAAVAEARGALEGLARLDAIEPAFTADYQPYHAVRAHLLQRAGRGAEAAAAYECAIELTDDAALRGFLAARRG